MKKKKTFSVRNCQFKIIFSSKNATEEVSKEYGWEQKDFFEKMGFLV